MNSTTANRYLIPGLLGLTLGTTSCGSIAEPAGTEATVGALGADAEGAYVNGSDVSGTSSSRHPGFGVPFPVASSSDNPVAVVATPESVIWAEADSVRFCPAAGCGVNSPTRVTGSSLPDAPLADTLAVDGTHAYWLASGSDGPYLQRSALTGGAALPETLLDAFPGPFFSGLVVAGGTAYAHNPWGAFGCSVNGCNRTASHLFGVYDSWTFSMAADATGLYMSQSGEAYGTFHCALGACPPAKLSPFESTIGKIVASNGHVYILTAETSGTLETCPATGCADGPTLLAADQSNVTAMAADSTGVYWTVGGTGGRVLRCELPSCAGGPLTVASGQQNPVSVAVNDDYVYWANAGGSLMAAEKL